MCLGIPGKIVSLDDPVRKLATVDISGIRRQINIACIVDETKPFDEAIGQWVLVHVGFAMSRIDEKEAMSTLQILTELGEAQEQIAAMNRARETVS